MNPQNVRFTQSTYDNQGQGYTVDGNIAALKNGTLSPDDLDPIKVFQKGEALDSLGPKTKYNYTGDPKNLANGEWYSLDNRRLAAFQAAGITDIPVKLATNSEVESQRWKFSTQNQGTSIDSCD